MRWQKIDEDVKKGDLGQVVGIKVSQGRLRVQFPKGQWKFKANDLSLCRIQPGLGVKMLKKQCRYCYLHCLYHSLNYHCYSYKFLYFFFTNASRRVPVLPFGGRGVEVCSLDAVLARPRTTVVAESCRSYGKSCKRHDFWMFQVLHSFISRGRRGTL